MCPSHVTKKWVREIGETLPDTYAMVVRNITDLNRLYAMYEQGDKSVYAVFSKERARDGYMRGPAVRWNRRRRAFLCPDCDAVIEMDISEDGISYTVPADQFFFRKENMVNHVCSHCGTPLWSAVNPSKRTEWVKIGEYGWVHRYGAAAHLKRTKNEKVIDQLMKIAEDPDGYYPVRGAQRRYPLSTYIKKKLRGKISGFLCDELHEYNNASGQGDAMAELYGVSKLFVGMTATLINGYSSGIFHLLYRIVPGLMLRDDKLYRKPRDFDAEYGVVENTYEIEDAEYNSNRRANKRKTKSRLLPGVSPLVFSRFLLEYAAFLSLTDMNKDLPSYEEIPIALEMPENVRKAYEKAENILQKILRSGTGIAQKILSAYLNLLTVYPDQPYDQPEIVHPIDGSTLVEPENCGDFSTLLPKEEAILNLVQQKVEDGERVLIYTSWTRTDSQQKLLKLMRENGYRTGILTKQIPTEKREEWVDKRVKSGLQVLITNPRCVETGLDLNAFIEPNQRCLIPAARNILDTPFYLVLYRQAMQPSGKDAGRWITDAFRDHLNNGTPEKTTLMLQMLLREINNLRSDITSAERELRGFILTKVLPYLGYQMALSSRLDPALTPIKSPNFFRRDAYARTYACLSAYLPTIDIWNEYKNQNPETLEKPWNTLRKLYQDSNPDISDLTAAIPYTVFPSGLLCHHGRNISFCHDNYRDFFAAFHIANVVYGLCNGINLAALSPDAQEVFLLQLETLDNSILFDAISILRQYFGLSIYDISAQDTTDLSDTCAQIALPAILIRLLDAVIRRGELSKNEHSQLCQLRSTLCERFVLSFKALDESDPLQTKYCLFFSLALSMLARDYRTGIAGTRDLIKCAGYAQQCINGEKKLNIPKADGYLQVALCLNARMEDMLNVTDTKMNGTLPFSSQLADAVREAVRDYHEGSMYKRDEAVRTFRRNLFPRWKPSLGNVLACCDIFQIILEAAYEKYVSAANQNNQNYQEIARLGYVSKAYLVLGAIGTSGGALNLLAQMLINQANQYEADQRISFFRRHPDIGTFVQQHAAPYGWPLNDNYALAYRVLQIVCGIQRGSQPYSHMKKAELVLKGYVSESSSTQLTSLNIAINGGLAMGHYWKGRLLLEQAKQDHDRCNDYKDAAIASFCATNVTERFDHLSENADEDAAPQLSPPQWLSAIELLRYPDREVFRVDRRMVFQTIYQKLTQQVEEVQSDRIQIHNERYRLTKKDVRSNMERCLDMVKVQFPDKEPLIQEMIRSIR